MRSCNWTASLPRCSSRPSIAAGDISAISPYLKALDGLDRYQTAASANQVYDDEARKKLMDKVNRLAENLGINEDFAAAVQAHLKKTGRIPADELGEEGAEQASGTEVTGEANAPEAPRVEVQASSGFFT
jgi:hypothetical protein